MTNKEKIKQLEKKCDKIIFSKDESSLFRIFECIDGKPIDEHGYFLSKKEMKQLEAENEKISAKGGLIIRLNSYKPNPKKLSVN